MNHLNQDKKPARKNTRTRVWPDTKATIKVADPFSPVRKILTISGEVGDLGGTGMFLVTKEPVPVPARAEIIIDFDSSQPSSLTLEALGETVRSAEDGVGIRFTDISMEHLQKCILDRMNR